MSPKSAVFVVRHHVSMVLDTDSPLAPPPPLHRSCGRSTLVPLFCSLHAHTILLSSISATVTSSFSEPNRKRELLHEPHGSAWPLPKHRFRHPLQSSRVGSGIAEDPKSWTKSRNKR
ncbi:unnamed protein product [Musa hybrid cultivar]